MRRAATLAMLLACASVEAHERSESYSNWRITNDNMTGVITVSASEIMPLVGLDNTRTLEDLFAEHLQERVAVRSVDGICDRAPPIGLSAARGFVRTELRFSCAGSAPIELHYRALLDELPTHVHYARIEDRGSFVAEVLITDRADRWLRDAAAQTPAQSFVDFLDLGVRHILSGYDHIAFLIGMLLLAGTVGRSVAAVTGFTLGHSISLAAAVVGYVHADGRIVEAFIGFTVALVAVEFFALRRRAAPALAVIAGLAAWLAGLIAIGAGLISDRALFAYLGFGVFAICYLLASGRMSVSGERVSSVALFTATTCFGLIHGFGFAGFLMQTGIRGDSLFLPLLGFNLGVEVGQLALIAVAFSLAWGARGTTLRRLAPVAAAALCGVGVYWFVGRSLSGF